MLRHIVAWNYKDGFTDIENKENVKKIKAKLEALTDYIDEIVELKVYTDTLPTGNRDIILSSLFENEEKLAAYQVHPEHVKAAEFVRSVVQDRACIDYYEI
jgi:hypothetical protein